MDGTHALARNFTTHEELLDSVRNLHQRASLKDRSGEPSLIRQQQEHEHTLHHANPVPNDGQGQDRECGHDAHAHSDGHGQDGHGHGHSGHDVHAHSVGHGQDGHGHGHSGHDAHAHTDASGHAGLGHDGHGDEHDQHDHSVHTMALGMSNDDSDSTCSSTMLYLIERNKLSVVGNLSASFLETQAARMAYNCGGRTVEVPTRLTPPLASSSMMSKTACQKLLSKQEVPSRPKLKRPKTATDKSKAMEFSDESVEELGNNTKAIGSRNLACERSRRTKLNQKLFSLRALVPRTTKLDKASIVGDAICYLQELQMQVEDIQNDILSLRIDNHALFADKHVDEASSHCTDRGMDVENFWHNVPIHRVLELSVSTLDENLYHLKVRCKNGPRVLVQLAKALESLNLNIVSANIASLGNLVLNTIVFKVFNSGEVLKPRELEERIVETVHMFGFHF